AFGIPELSLRELSETRVVVSPYASFLALAVDASAGLKNIRRMKNLGWCGTFGFYESADFGEVKSCNRLEYEVVRCWMAHHQGMILLSICNLLSNCAVQNVFHSEPMIAAAQRLLEERVPRASEFKWKR